ncbi:cysteine--tRNA ligase [Facklamia languida]|nr:cysteine--tRNA ligase [Facklamia languida]
MTIQVYNTLTRQKEVFTPQEEGKVTFYVCGPTVYNYIHIGNARSAVAFDTIRRYLEYKGYEVVYVSNFTDVDDKIIKASQEEGLTPKDLADKYIAAFKEDTQQINVKEATLHPRVMENIPEIIDFIQVLIDKGYAYESQGDVYYRTDRFDHYGQLSDQSIADLRQGASERVRDEERQRKEQPLDFALWKQAKEGEIAWPSPWGHGRPGWHIECSVMATKFLGESLDIHGGGFDLQFPHHENEIAQSEAHADHDHPFAHYWLHNGFVTIGQDDEKMSKSLNNFVLLRDLLKDQDPMVVRYLLTSVHYRRPLRYDRQSLEDAQATVERLREVLRRMAYRIDHPGGDQQVASEVVQDQVDQQVRAFEAAMDDDFNVANALSALFEMVKMIHRYLDLPVINSDQVRGFQGQLEALLMILGLDLTVVEDLDATIQALIDERQAARQAKDFKRADAIRDQLKAQNILLDDTPQGTTWKRGS